MKRIVKLRAWNPEEKRMTCGWPLSDLLDRGPMFADEDWPIMQFTGLTDKNGRDIYEGDIVRAFDDNDLGADVLEGAVEWGLGEWVFAQKHLGRIWRKQYTLEVIGNIYENPNDQQNI